MAAAEEKLYKVAYTRKSRKGVEITPWKGGRTARIEARIVPAAKARLMDYLQTNNLSLADWLEEKISKM